MCGIAGLVDIDGIPADRDFGRQFVERLAHRGPDSCGVWSDQNALLAHTRLAIRDLSPAGAQPLSAPGHGIVVAYNGEIYNYSQLRQELENAAGDRNAYRFQGTSDTEIIPAGYLAWGEDVFARLEGMFSIALWDQRSRTLLLARDGIGVKPLYYSIDRRRVLFASELKAMMAALPRRTIDASALHTFFAQGHPGPRQTLLSGVVQLPPGSIARLDPSGLSVRHYWAPRRRPESKPIGQTKAEFKDTFQRVCKDMLVADVPVGILQSGGIDSSLISLSLRDPSHSLFCGAFASKDHDESRYAQLIAKEIGAQLIITDCDAPDRLEEDFRSIVWHMDGQLADASALAAYRLFREVRRHVKVVLSGDGADEFFCGYDTYGASRLAPILSLLGQRACRRLGQALFNCSPTEGSRYPYFERLGRLFSGAAAGSLAHPEWRRYLMPWDAPALYGSFMKDVANQDPLAEYRDYLRADLPLLDNCLLADQAYYLPSDMLVKVDRMSMAHGLEVRVPFLDRRIMELAGQVPSRHLGCSLLGNPKRLLRSVAAELGAPREIVNKSKSGFNVPAASLLRGPLQPLGDLQLDKRADDLEPYLKADQVRTIWQAHKSGRANHDYLLWSILTFSIWRESI